MYSQNLLRTKTKIEMNRMNRLIYAFIVMGMLAGCSQPTKQPEIPSMAKVYESKFLVGTAMNTPQIEGTDSSSIAIILSDFNSVVAENCMKSEVIHPEQGRYDFKLSDQFVKFGLDNHMFIVGHTLVWHSQAPDWLFVDSLGNDVSRDTLIERLRNHIFTVVGRYKGQVNGWDVVNESFEDDGTYRQSKFYQIIGKDYIELAFKFAQEADSNAELYYNDYSLPKSAKRDSVVKMVNELKEKGIRIDAIGMQGHYTIDFPTFEAFDSAIMALSSTGSKIMITELDMTLLPNPDKNVGADISRKYELRDELNPYKDGLPDSVKMVLSERYTGLFNVLLKHSDVVSRVTFWGVNDQQSWRNYWPVNGRVDYPLLFDRSNQPKQVYYDLINLVEKSEKE